LESTTQIPVHFTTGARQEIKKILAQGPSGSRLRVGVKGGGCAGMSYILDFDQPGPGDELYEMDGIPMILNKAHAIYLLGMEVDFQHGLNARGFTFSNPNAGTTCGCGSSFSAK